MAKFRFAIVFAFVATLLSSCSDDPVVDPGTPTVEFENYGAPSSATGNRIVKNSAGDLLLATGGGLFRYKFSTQSWEGIGQGISSDHNILGMNIDDVAIMQNGNVVCGVPGRALYVSTDNGDTWKATVVNVSFKGMRFYIGNIFESWVSIKGEDGKYTAWRTEDNGLTWAARVTPMNAPEERISLCFNDSDDVFFANGDGLYRSLDSGRTYQIMSSATGINYLYCNTVGSIIAFTDAGGMVSTDSGRGLAVGSGISGGMKEVIKSSSGKLYSVGSYTTPNSGALWSSANDGITWTLEHDFTRPINSVAEAGSQLYVASSGFGVLASQNLASWTSIGPGVSTIYGLAVDNSDNLLAASYGIFRSGDGSSWASYGTSSELSTHIAYSNLGIVARTTGGMAYVSTDGGNGWTAIPGLSDVAPIAFMPNGNGVVGTNSMLAKVTIVPPAINPLPISGATNVKAIAVSNSYSIYYSGTTTSGIGTWRSLDSGKTFSNANSGIENIIMTSMAVNVTGSVYASDGTKLYSSKDNGTSWTTSNIGGLQGGDKVNAMTFRSDGKLYLWTNYGIIRSKTALE
jgi:hypothetical protein